MPDSPWVAVGEGALPEQFVIATAPAVGDLERLLETERRLEEVVGRARQDAAALTARARDDAARRERDAAAESQVAAAELDATVARESAATAAALEADAARQVADWGAVPPERIAALADGLTARVIALARVGLG